MNNLEHETKQWMGLPLNLLWGYVAIEGVQNSVSGKILQFHHTIQSSFKINGQLA